MQVDTGAPTAFGDSLIAFDLAQDFDTIVPSTLEEAYELVAAIEQRDFPHIAEELGDLLFQVIFYAQLGAERELFDFAEIVSILASSLNISGGCIW